MCCSKQASCCGGGPEEGVFVSGLVYLTACLARMTDEGGGEVCRGDGGSGDGWWVVVLLAVVVFVSQPASERHSTDDLKLAMSDDARLPSPSQLQPARLEARRHPQSIHKC